MKKFVWICLCIILIDSTHAQSVSINTDGSQPNASAMLDIKNANKGLLIPRVSLVSETDVTTVPSPVTSLLVFNTNAALPDGMGFYFWNSSKWNKLITGNATSNFSWNVGGNIAADTNFIGTTNNTPLVFKTNNILSGKIDPNYKNVFLGQGAGLSNSLGRNNYFFGHQAGYNNTSGFINIAIGSSALFKNKGNRNIALGDSALFSNSTGNENVANGPLALYSNISGSFNSATGFQSLYSNTTGAQNIANGYQSLFSNTTGGNNIANGFQSLLFNTTGSNNIALGFWTLYSNTTGYYNIAHGAQSLFSNTSGAQNLATGQKALYSNTTGNNNIATGDDALLLNISGTGNIAYGYRALYSNTSGNNNIAIGDSADVTLPSLNNATAIGSNSKVSTSNTMAFGDGNVKHWVFGRSSVTPLQYPVINRALQVGTNATNGNGAYLTAGGAWTNTSSRMKKEDFTELNGDNLLQKISQLSIQKWKYKGSIEYHIGPVAEDFYNAFGLGTDDQGISTVDPAGIALAAIKEQQHIIEKQSELISELQKRIDALEKNNLLK